MGSDLKITNQLQEYILDHGLKLHPIQKEIINYNTSLGDIKKMQIAISQCQFLHLIIKISNIKNVLEIGTFTGLSTLSMALALTENGKITTLDKNEETNKIAINFFKKAKQDHKIKTIIKPALESLDEIKDQTFDLIFKVNLSSLFLSTTSPCHKTLSIIIKPPRFNKFNELS